MLAEAPPRCIEAIQPVLLMLFSETGRLPSVSDPDRTRFGFRSPGLSEMQHYTWIVEWEGQRLDERGFRKVAGVAAYRDDYDYHSLSDVRELVSLSGSGRSVRNLVLWMRDDARVKERRLIGSFERANEPLKSFLAEIGFVETPRLFMEDAK
jgi:hypothetical protein